MKEQRVLVCGGRTFFEAPVVYGVLDGLLPVVALAHGGASGADARAQRWAVSRDVPIQCYSAEWKKHGKSAGPIRNAHMLADFKPDVVVAFPGGRGTADMVRRATVAGVRVIRIVWDGYTSTGPSYSVVDSNSEQER